ncbi:MAG TPA: DUF3099 domain-containing protein [Microbacteriaceae bacterium]|nr:DUF3099 domain-containing protein [Microbacteriaceae bacterium]
MKKKQSITSLPLSPEDDRRSRMMHYSVAMGIRFVCIVALLFVHGWWLILPGLGAVFIPYFAVVVANFAHNRGQEVERPGNVTLVTPPAPQGAGAADGARKASSV